MTLVWTLLMLLGAIGLIVGPEWLWSKFRHRREQLDTHRSEADPERDINIQHARSQDWVDF